MLDSEAELLMGGSWVLVSTLSGAMVDVESCEVEMGRLTVAIAALSGVWITPRAWEGRYKVGVCGLVCGAERVESKRSLRKLKYREALVWGIIEKGAGESEFWDKESFDSGT